MSKKKTNEPNYRRGITFTQNKKPAITMSIGKILYTHLDSSKKGTKVARLVAGSIINGKL